MKSLSIKSDDCVLSKNSYDVKINDTGINNLVKNNLPEGLEDYRDYPVKVEIHIEFLGGEELKIETQGYETKKEENEESIEIPFAVIEEGEING